MTWAAVIGFFLAVLPLTMTPGASFTLATQRTLSGERHAAGWVVAGTATGIYCHAMLAAVGLSALVMRSSQAFTVVKVAGAVYLIGLGLATLRKARRQESPRELPRLPWAGHHTYPQALLANVLNPKAASIYLTLAPQFLSTHQVGYGPMLVLATAHVTAMTLWLTLWSVLLVKGRRWTSSRRFRDTFSRVGGVILIALGIRTAVTT
jgi:threonine/homoserine/homoserine lactone efflux protein